MPTKSARLDADPAQERSAASPRDLLPALFVLFSTWSLLATQSLLAARVGHAAAVALSFGAATALLIATRRRTSAPAPARAAALGALGFLAGFVSFPAWIAAIGSLGIALGLQPVAPPPRPESLPLLVAVLGFAPVFEELLYRERLLLALRSRVGAGLAIAISSVCFALPHLEAWSVLATTCVGVALGMLMLAGRAVALCVGMHAGLNLAAVVCGIPPTRLALPAALAFVCGSAAIGVGLSAARARFGIFATDRH